MLFTMITKRSLQRIFKCSRKDARCKIKSFTHLWILLYSARLWIPFECSYVNVWFLLLLLCTTLLKTYFMHQFHRWLLAKTFKLRHCHSPKPISVWFFFCFPISKHTHSLYNNDIFTTCALWKLCRLFHLGNFFLSFQRDAYTDNLLDFDIIFHFVCAA